MTEAEWLDCTDLATMMRFIQRKTSDRKRRLFMCACVRLVWHVLEDARSRKAVEVAEGFVERQVTADQLKAAYEAAWDAAWDAAPAIATNVVFAALRDAGFAAFRDVDWARNALFARAWESSWEGARAAAKQAAGEEVSGAGEDAIGVSATTVARATQTTLFRDLFGNPFRPTIIAPSVLAWNDGLVVCLAQAAYDKRQLAEGTLDNGRLAVLADALEEAGCTNPDMLSHCHRPGAVHARGCWVIDAILGKS